MPRSTMIAAAATLAMLAGCGTRHDTADGTLRNATMVADNVLVEDVSPDSLAAPDDMPLDSESNGGGGASGGNVG